VVYYQTNPQAHWGPASRAKNVPATVIPKVDKRKTADAAKEEDEVDTVSKKAKIEETEEEGMNA
jgi:hypothetical protein